MQPVSMPFIRPELQFAAGKSALLLADGLVLACFGTGLRVQLPGADVLLPLQAQAENPSHSLFA